MSGPDPVKALGTWRAVEAGYEAGLPLLAAGGAWFALSKLFTTPSPVRPPTGVELAVVLGVAVALTGWMISRQFFLLRRRNPWSMILVSVIFNAIILFALPRRIAAGFEEKCVELGGAVVQATDMVTEAAANTVCQVGGVPGNPYLPGVIFRPPFPDDLSPALWVFLALIAAISVLGFRDKKIRASTLPSRLFDSLRLAPSQGIKSSAGKPKAEPDNVVACGNPTFWGETCGQLYSGDKKWLPGERCVRCHQPFAKAKDELTFTVVTLFSGDVDVLNGLERMDTNAWVRGGPIPPDGRISGQERWVTLGRITLPAVITVAQALSLIHDKLKDWESAANGEAKDAAKLAMTRASRISAWVWFGRVNHLLTYATPTRRASLAIGPMRLKDIVPHIGEDLTLQLDIGLLPLDLWTGSKMSFAENRPPVLQNSHFTMWIPVSPPKSEKKRQGLWVPRVEGDALRAWLSTDRLKKEDEEAAGTIPLAYASRQAAREDLTPPEEMTPVEGSLDLVRLPMNKAGAEPIMDRGVGDSISEWAWLEWQQIELLRQQALVLVETPVER
ncbi:MAG: hypothetical protein VX899_19195 [Myxococcota bacterium]|nr:hypothetical protein [Myxococcota bacterium]